MSSKLVNQTRVQEAPVPRRPAKGLLQRERACGQHKNAGAACAECSAQSAEGWQRPALNVVPAETAPALVQEVLTSPGRPLEQETRAFMEPRFSHDFSRVRVHTDAAAAESARAVNALAYTVGQQVVFGAGQYAPTTSAGRRMLAHELTHVVQQRSAPSFAGLPVGVAERQGEREGEREADAVASRVMMGLPIHVRQANVALQRYGHDHSCKDDEHLKPFIWPGHDHAKKITQRALEETDGRKLHPNVIRHLTSLFGKSSTDSATVAQIHANFEKIQTSLNQEYLYHCAKNEDKLEPGAVTCNVQNASTNPSGRKDITLCFDQVKGWSAAAAAWVIVHENVHRGLNVWGHDWEAGKVDRCINSPPAPVNLQLSNPDAYACFALLMWDLG